MDLLSTYAYRPRRIRLEFTSAVASGGFVSSLYSVTSEDSTSASPNIRAVYAVAGQPSTVELVLDFDMVDGAAYVVTAVGVPAVAGGSTPGGTSGRFRFSQVYAPADVEPLVSDLDVILFGRDLIWNGNDFEEGTDGDLARVSGVPNVLGALDRRLKGSPLPYAADYSPNAREFVDSNDAAPLGSRLRQQALRDPRVKSVRVEASETTDGDTVFIVSPKLIGGTAPQPISITLET
jgi:hypothetical protein